MKTIINKIANSASKLSKVLLLATVLIGLLSCDKQGDELTKLTNDLTIRFQKPPSISVDVETRAELSSMIIENAWVLQFDTDGNLLKKQYIANEGDFTQESAHLVEAVTDGFDNIDSRFYVIVNGGQDLISSSTNYTETELKKISKSSGTDITAEYGFLTAGPIEFKKQETDNGKAVLVAPLERPYAKISVRYTLKQGASFVAKSASIANIPTKMAIYRRGGGDLASPYPILNDINKTESTIGGTTSGWNPNIKKEIFIPENLRGIGTSTTFAGKNLTKNGPVGSLEGCTYVIIKGEYKYSGSHTGAVGVEYRFYLGGNLMNDYNIQRGTHYEIAVNIAGANSADVRVTITNGNVVVFDQVQEISSTITFN